jgi:hypothetical protein
MKKRNGKDVLLRFKGRKGYDVVMKKIDRWKYENGFKFKKWLRMEKINYVKIEREKNYL